MKNNFTQQDLDEFFTLFSDLPNSLSIKSVHHLVNAPNIKAKQRVNKNKPLIISSIAIMALSIFLLCILFNTFFQDNPLVQRITNFDKNDTLNQQPTISIDPYDNLKHLDLFLKNISNPPQSYIIASDKNTKVIGKGGTIIHLNPNNLLTKDGSVLGDSINVELIEILNKPTLIMNNAQTTSNGELLITGGAYYINMTSNNKQLRINERGINVEFPKLSNSQMELFWGERDSSNQMNWKQLNQKFKVKKLKEPVKPVRKPDLSDVLAISIWNSEDESEIRLQKPKEVKKENSSPEIYKKYKQQLAEYEKKKRESELKRRTYESIKILNLGWINCDKFIGIPSTKANIELNVSDSTITSAKFFCIFKEMQSITSTHYINSRPINEFKNIPEKSKVKIIGLALKDLVPYWFEKDIVVNKSTNIQANFIESSQDDIKLRIESIN